MTVFTLPTVADSSFGDIFAIVTYVPMGFTVAQNANNQIYFGNMVTTAGAGGSVTTVPDTDYNSLTLVCVFNDGTNSKWGLYDSPQGNYTIV